MNESYSNFNEFKCDDMIKNDFSDIRKLSRDFPGFDADKIINNCVDSGTLANTVLPCKQRWSMEKLVDYRLNMAIDKNKKVRMSKWHLIPLSDMQLKYAATDAYVSLLLYHDLKKIEMSMTNLEITEITT